MAISGIDDRSTFWLTSRQHPITALENEFFVLTLTLTLPLLRFLALILILPLPSTRVPDHQSFLDKDQRPGQKQGQDQDQDQDQEEE